MRALIMLALAWTAVAADAARYELYPGDLVEIRVFAEPDLSLPLRVPREGPIDFPLIGALDTVAGRTPEDLAAEIARRLRDGWLRAPVVTASVTQFGPRRAHVLGAVARPTEVPLDPLGSVTAMQAIGAAGGFEPDADRAAMHVIRAGDEVPLAIAGEGAALDLRPGDVVVVPRRDRVYVLGQVARPGPYPLPEEGPLTVSRAVAAAGGLERFAKSGSVQVVRAGRRVATVDLRKVLAGERPEADRVLEAGDTVFVPESRF